MRNFVWLLGTLLLDTSRPIRGQGLKVDDFKSLLFTVEKYGNAKIQEDVLVTMTLQIRKDQQVSLSGDGYGLDGANLVQLIRISDGGRIFIDDLVLKRGFSVGNGGALLIENRSSARLRHTTILNNRASRGAAVSVLRDSQLVATDCIFEDNVVSARGGGIYVEQSSTLDLRDNSFLRNAANRGADIYLYMQSTMTVARNKFKKSKALERAGAIYIDRYSSADATHCQFDQSYRALYVSDQSTVLISNSSNLSAYVSGNNFRACSTDSSIVPAFQQCYDADTLSFETHSREIDEQISSSAAVATADMLFGQSFSFLYGTLSVAYST